MPPERDAPGSAGDWLDQARSDLALARAPLPEGAIYEDLCYHAQQAAEKALKAIYRYRESEFRYTHDIGELINGLPLDGKVVPASVFDAIELTEFATLTRYPGVAEPTTETEYERAIAAAMAVVAWADELTGY
ncbi:MAG TPA: HEPN domain-containing protein [Candidatus Latescibacteria bacterium]|nr:HEPN domain-containing protein [Candidatus Latescibacterota bacterium]